MKKVLVVDDHLDIRKMVRLVLHKHFDVMEAADAEEAMKLILLHRPDALLLDVMMPGDMDGFDLCERIKQDNDLAHIHVVMMTALAQVSNQEHGQQLGADAYFTKPFSPYAVLRYLNEALGERGVDTQP